MRIATAHLRSGVATAIAFLLVVSSTAPVAFATPSTPEIAAKQAEADAARTELERMNTELEVRVEQYNAFSEALEQTREQIRVTQADLERAERSLADARRTLADRAASIYRSGGASALDVFLGARSFDDFMLRLDLAVRISRSDATMVENVKDAKSRVETANLTLEQRQVEQVFLQSEASIRADQIASEVEAQERFVRDLTVEVKALVAAEEERQRQLAEERARQAALAARAAAQAAAARNGSSSARRAADSSELGGGHPEVVTIALQQLGVPYVWSGSTPAGFDCSGLTQYCYGKVGITIPRTSASQFSVGQHIARDRLDLLKPGDLVFFGTDGDATRIHHVGMYVGDGNYLHAPYSGAVVRVDSLTGRITNRADYVGASRI